MRASALGSRAGRALHLASLHDSGDGALIIEDFDTVAYMAETVDRPRFEPKLVFMEDLRWDVDSQRFLDGDDAPIRQIFKLYPWEWMHHRAVRQVSPVSRGTTQWVEPAWKLLLSNKQLLVVLWELFPDHPNLLPAFADAGCAGRPSYVSQAAARAERERT